MCSHIIFIFVVLFASAERGKPEVATADPVDSKINGNGSFLAFGTDPFSEEWTKENPRQRYLRKRRTTDPEKTALLYLGIQWKRFKNCHDQQTSKESRRKFYSRRWIRRAKKLTYDGHRTMRDCIEILRETLGAPEIADLPIVIASVFSFLIASMKRDVRKQDAGVNRRGLIPAEMGSSSYWRIIGGSDAADGEHPYMASVRFEDRHACGGSVIHDRLALTAAHCIQDQKIYGMTVVVGSTLINAGGDIYPVEEVFPYPDRSADLKNDIGLILVQGKFVFGRKVRPIALPTEDFIEDDYPAVLPGWGYTSNSGRTHNVLQHILVDVLPLKECMKYSPQIDETDLCTLTREGEGFCMGDSGGPLVADGVQIGVASKIPCPKHLPNCPCASGIPDYYARVWSFVDWIDYIVDNVDRH